ncbi:NADH-quinone oxidoreductase subunit C [Dechloromonas sp. A34]|uniref:hydrogenase large subunit n=1 Tax=Dechloromonas sp. A34 TaxID=447588 RepID=UPI002249514F|nr:NADH-quinone oxidoreductase subunit C [Dechloromonas sp. A34]
MQFAELFSDLQRLPTPLPIWRGQCAADDWLAAARTVVEAGGRLVSLWGSDRHGQYVVSAAYATGEGMLWLDLPLAGAQSRFPDLTGLFPCAGRMQRAVADLLGVVSDAEEPGRPWLNHGAWADDYFPLRHTASGEESFAELAAGDYPFVRVEGEGVHEIAVGPVHAGIIEPGHFRFSVVGEKVLRLEERLGYKHKGIDKRFEKFAAGEGHRLAGRVSGDSTVAFAWAYCMALESIRGTEPPPRAAWLRALMLERERVANHLGDLGALGNDAAFAFGLAQFMRLKEDWLRLNKSLFGHRFMMDCIVPGGVAVDLEASGIGSILAQCNAIEKEVKTLRAIYENHAGLQDRFITTGRVTPQLAAQLGLAGMAGRASGMAIDLRAGFPMAPYGDLEVRMASHRNGDVAARVTVRFEEVLESLRLIRGFVVQLPPGEVTVALAESAGAGRGAGWIEGWRGEVFVALETEGDQIRRCHCHDPSWQNWPVLEHAVMGNIVPDFPLINKSFNLSYSGHDR